MKKTMVILGILTRKGIRDDPLGVRLGSFRFFGLPCIDYFLVFGSILRFWPLENWVRFMKTLLSS